MTKETSINVVVQKISHRKSDIILLTFKYNDKLIQLLKELKVFKWSKSNRGWYCGYSDTNLNLIKKQVGKVAQLSINTNSLEPKMLKYRKRRNLTEANKEFIRNYVNYLKGKRYSESTVKTYFTFIADFIDYIQPKKIENLTYRDVEKFIEDEFAPRNYSISSQRQFISAVKLLVKFYPECNIEEIKLERPKKSRKLPTVLSQNEVIKILQNTTNLKHRAILGLIYSSGLRIGELINLKLEHINFERKQLQIKNAKGRKDRYVIIADSIIPLVMNYLNSYKPKIYFVEGNERQPYTAGSVRAFLKKSCKLSGIQKPVTPHTLRHSYATHLMENGTDIRIIQELLGHSKPETTMIYTHVSKKSLLTVKSPLDLAVKNYINDKKMIDN